MVLFDGVVELTQNVVWLTKKTYIHDAGAREKRRNIQIDMYSYISEWSHEQVPTKKPIIIINKQDIKAS